MDIVVNVAITNHVKAGNLEEAVKLIETLSKFDKQSTSLRISKLLAKSSSLSAKDIEALKKKKELLDNSVKTTK